MNVGYTYTVYIQIKAYHDIYTSRKSRLKIHTAPVKEAATQKPSNTSPAAAGDIEPNSWAAVRPTNAAQMFQATSPQCIIRISMETEFDYIRVYGFVVHAI